MGVAVSSQCGGGYIPGNGPEPKTKYTFSNFERICGANDGLASSHLGFSVFPLSSLFLFPLIRYFSLEHIKKVKRMLFLSVFLMFELTDPFKF